MFLLVIIEIIEINNSQNMSATNQGASSVQFTLTMTDILICGVDEEFLYSIVLESKQAETVKYWCQDLNSGLNQILSSQGNFNRNIEI